MPEPMPNGSPIRLATAKISPVPTIAFAIPPPTSPGGFGVWVRKARFTEPIPLITRYTKMASSGTSTSTTASTANTVAPWLMMRRPRLTSCGAEGDTELGTHPRSPPGDAPDQQPRQRVDDESHNEKSQPDLHQGAEIQIAGGLGELVGNDAGHGVAGCEQRLRHLGTVSDDHGHRHGLAQRAPQAEDNAAHDADARIAENAHADHFPARGAQRQHRLTLVLRDRRHHLARNGSYDRHHHNRQDDARRQHAQAIHGAAEEPRPS